MKEINNKPSDVLLFFFGESWGMDIPKDSTQPKHWFYGNESVDFEEMNSVEFPLALLARQIPKTLRESKRLEFKDTITDFSTKTKLDRSLVISANVDSELPNYWDQDVLVALQVLTGRKFGWETEVVQFTIYEVLKLMQLKNDGRNIARLIKSLDNWQGIRFKYSHWRKGDAWVHPKAFGIIQYYDLTRKRNCNPESPQEFAWNRLFFDSVKASNTKPFDADFYFRLKLPTSRRLYRFGEKRLNAKRFYSKPLVPFCTEKLGMTPGQYPSNYRTNLGKAYDELVSERFLADLPSARRFREGNDGTINVNFQRGPGRKNRSVVSVPSTVFTQHEQALVDRGCSADKVKQLRGICSDEQMLLVVEWFDWEIKRKSKIPNPGGWIYKACKENWQPPKDFKTKTQRAEDAKKKAEKARLEAAEREEEKQNLRRQRESERIANERFKECRESMSEAERVSLEDDALKNVEEFMRSQVLKARRKGDIGMFHQMLWEKHIMPQLEASPEVQPK